MLGSDAWMDEIYILPLAHRSLGEREITVLIFNLGICASGGVRELNWQDEQVSTRIDK